MIPERLLRTGESPELVREHDDLFTYVIWRGSRRPRRVATITTGRRPEQLPADLLALLPKFWPRPGTMLALERAAAMLADWARRAGGTSSGWLDLLVGAGYLVRYQPLSSDGLSPGGTPSLGPGCRGEELLQMRAQKRDDVHRLWAEQWLTAASSTPPLSSAPGERLTEFLWEARKAIAAGSAVNFPGDAFSSGSVRQGHTQIALDFLVAIALRVATGDPFDWKEIGSHYRPSIGASKQFDAHQERLLSLLESITGTSPSGLGLISLGSLYSLYGVGELTYHIGGTERTTPPRFVWSITSDELETMTLDRPLMCVVLLTENRALLLKMARTGWAHERRVLVLGIDGQPRSGLRRLLKLIPTPLLAWVDSDAAGMVIGEILNTDLPRLRWILPPLSHVPATEVGSIEQWRVRMGQRLTVGAQEQELTMNGPATWDLLLESALSW